MGSDLHYLEGARMTFELSSKVPSLSCVMNTQHSVWQCHYIRILYSDHAMRARPFLCMSEPIHSALNGTLAKSNKLSRLERAVPRRETQAAGTIASIINPCGKPGIQ